MKTKRSVAFGLVLILALSLALAGCGKTQAMVRINDRGVITEIEVGLPETVEKILQTAEITLNEGDEVTPGLAEKLEAAGEIVIARKNTVKLVIDGEEREVVVIGGTVKDLLAQEKITLSENQHLNVEEDTYLTDGMVVSITTTYKVSIICDGGTKEVETEEMSVGDLLKAQGVELGSDDLLEPAKDSMIREGMEIVIRRVTFEEIEEVEELEFETVREEDGSLAQGTEETVTEGEKGEKKTVYKIKYIDGEEDSREAVSEEITKEPVNEVIKVGTYEAPAVYEVSRTAYPNCADGTHGYYEIHYSDGSVAYVEY